MRNTLKALKDKDKIWCLKEYFTIILSCFLTVFVVSFPPIMIVGGIAQFYEPTLLWDKLIVVLLGTFKMSVGVAGFLTILFGWLFFEPIVVSIKRDLDNLRYDERKRRQLVSKL